MFGYDLICSICGTSLTYSQPELVEAVLVDFFKGLPQGERVIHQRAQVFTVIVSYLHKVFPCSYLHARQRGPLYLLFYAVDSIHSINILHKWPFTMTNSLFYSYVLLSSRYNGDFSSFAW